MEISNELKSSNFIIVIDCFEWQGQFYIVREYCEKGLLKDEIDRLKEEKMSLNSSVFLSLVHLFISFCFDFSFFLLFSF
jgi:serine/threonine protein kinase